MENKNLNVSYTVYAHRSELPEFWQKLLQQAENTLPQAYAPYSDFKVGAALLLDNGEVVTGTNQENSAFPSGLCAERTALYYALSKYPDAHIQGLAITTSSSHTLCAPCGACRQVLADAELKRTGPFPILFPGGEGSWLLFEKIADILPFGFSF
ncbi:MAG: cytidine deaminase [Flavobacteriales bacterium]|nr:cytidine deaminase [Flavobacteriales bacterium]